MESRKEKEIEYYNGRVEESLKGDKNGDFEGFKPEILSSFRFFYDWLVKNCQQKIILDYGCGNGIHSVFLAKSGAQRVIGIDLSENSLEIARKRAEVAGFKEKIEFKMMDCEKMEFPPSFFDIIFDGGTFSSLDFKIALPELTIVLKSDGFLIGAETLGHNPFTNLKRKINKLTGKRTEWAASHIFQIKDLEEAKKYFNKIETNFFHLTSWVIFPFLGLPGAKFLLKIFETLDRILLKIPFLRKYAFKIVFIFSQPNKQYV